MKKTTALLFAFMMMTCTFAACGKSDSKSNSGSKETKVSASTDSKDNNNDKTEPVTKKKLPSVTIVKPTLPAVNQTTDFVGVWESIHVSENGYELKDEINGVDVKGLFRIEAFEDGTGYAEITGEKSTFKWEKKDKNKIVITDDSDGEKDEISIYGKRFVMGDDELKITFEKVK